MNDNQNSNDDAISFREVNITLRSMQKNAEERNRVTVDGIQKINNKLDAISMNYVQSVDFATFRHLVETNYTSNEKHELLRQDFKLVRQIVYGLVSLILIGFIGVLVSNHIK